MASSSKSFLFVSIKKYVRINLTYTNYLDWKSQIIRVLKSFKLYGHITGQSVCPSPYRSSNPDYSFWIQKDTTIISWIYVTLSPIIHAEIHDILEKILGIDFPIEKLSARQIWLAIDLFYRVESCQLQPKFELRRDRLRAIQHPVPDDSDTQCMVDWSNLPQDILRLIAKCLEICFDVTHFRSVCSSWRSSVPPQQPCLLPASFPLINPYDVWERTKCFYLSKRVIVLLTFPMKPGQWVPDPRLVKIEQGKGKGMHLLHPLSNSGTSGSPLLDFMNCQVIELSRQYVVHYEVNYRHFGGAGYTVHTHTRKAAFMWSSTEENNYFVLLVEHWYQKFAMFSSRDQQWTTILENTRQSCEDIISFNGKFYAIDVDGRTTVVEPSTLNVSFLAMVDSGTIKQLLVESGGQLLLVQMFLGANLSMNMVDKQKCFRSPMEIVWFKVYKLNEAGQEWEYVKHLGDHVLFFGKDSAFSASASIFSWCERNSIIFSSNRIRFEDMFMFNYEDGSVEQIFQMSHCHVIG